MTTQFSNFPNFNHNEITLYDNFCTNLQNALQNIFSQKIVNKYDFVEEWDLNTNQDKVATKPPLITEDKTEDEILQQYIDQARFIPQGDWYWELK